MRDAATAIAPKATTISTCQTHHETRQLSVKLTATAASPSSTHAAAIATSSTARRSPRHDEISPRGDGERQRSGDAEGDHEERAGLDRRRIVQRRELGERPDDPDGRRPRTGRTRIATAWATTQRARGPSSGIADQSANALAITRPTGTATTKPVLLPVVMTRGVASACSPRNAADAMNDIDTRNSRPSARRRADVPTDQARTAAIAAAPSTSQKCDGW